jgi:2-dehydropantoate 2-reductase
LVALKTTANDQFAKLLPALVSAGTVILTLQNGLGNEELLARLFPAEQIMGGLCFVCLNRLEPGLIQHIDHGQIVVGEFGRWPEPRTHEIASLFRHSGVPCAVSDNLARAHWEKLTWSIPFNGLGVASAAGLEPLLATGSLSACLASEPTTPHSALHIPRSLGVASAAGLEPLLAPGSSPASPASEPTTPHSALHIPRSLGACLTTDKLLADSRWHTLVRELMLEVIMAARALGCDLPELLVDKQIERTRTMGAYKASTLLDFERGKPLELKSLFLEPLRQARAAGVKVPRLEALCTVLQTLDKGP